MWGAGVWGSASVEPEYIPKSAVRACSSAAMAAPLAAGAAAVAGGEGAAAGELAASAGGGNGFAPPMLTPATIGGAATDWLAAAAVVAGGCGSTRLTLATGLLFGLVSFIASMISELSSAGSEHICANSSGDTVVTSPTYAPSLPNRQPSSYR